MEKKSKWVYILGWLVIISGASFLISDIFGNYFFKIAVYLKMVSAYIAIVPTEVPWLVVRLINILIFFIWAWAIFILLCGIGILRFSHIARVTFLVLNILRIIFLLIGFFIAKYKVFDSWEYLLVLGIPFLYIIYFTRPKVKEQFR